MRISGACSTRYLLFRLLALAGLIGIYYLVDWTFVRQALRSVLMLLLALLGHPAAALDKGSDLYLLVGHNRGGHTFAITSSCIYVDLVLILAPFCWRFRRSLGANALRLAVLTAGVLGLNVLRMVTALYLFWAGISWQWAHHIPNILVYFSLITPVVLLALRSDRQPAGISPP